MTYQARQSGAHVLLCESSSCRSELMAPSQSELIEDAELVGWREVDGKHVCPGCTRGVRRLPSQIIKQLVPMIPVSSPVKPGDPVLSPTGTQVGTYTTAAEPGGFAGIDLVPVDEALITEQVSEEYARVLDFDPLQVSTMPAPPGKGRDDLDELFDEFTAQASSRPVDASDHEAELDEVEAEVEKEFEELTKEERLASLFPAARKAPTSSPNAQQQYQPGKPAGRLSATGKPIRTLTAPAGTSGGEGLVQEPERPDPARVAAAHTYARAGKRAPTHGVKIEAINETDALFGDLEAHKRKTGWTPDDK